VASVIALMDSMRGSMGPFDEGDVAGEFMAAVSWVWRAFDVFSMVHAAPANVALVPSGLDWAGPAGLQVCGSRLAARGSRLAARGSRLAQKVSHRTRLRNSPQRT
jgi:hypothetical protein